MHVDHPEKIEAMQDGRYMDVQLTECVDTSGGWKLTGKTTANQAVVFGLMLPDLIFRPGDFVRLFITDSNVIQGIDHNGEEVKFTPAAELEAARELLESDIKARQAERFEQDRNQIDRDFYHLSPAMQRRIRRFRKSRPSWRQEFEEFEIACSAGAELIAAYLEPFVEVDATANDIRLLADRLFDQEDLPESVLGVTRKAFSDEALAYSTVLAGDILIDCHTPQRYVQTYARHACFSFTIGCSLAGCEHDVEAPADAELA